jgi:ketosteroid isomerase-like protein
MPEATTVFRAVDAQDLDTLKSMFTADARFVFANQEPLLGIDAILAGNAAFFSMVQRIKHELLRVWVVDETTIAETAVTYTRLDGKEVTLPAVTIWDIDEADLITNFQVSVDTTPVFIP